VEIASVDEGQVDSVVVAQPARGVEAAESAAHDHDAVP
jgi:hypothetical protein